LVVAGIAAVALGASACGSSSHKSTPSGSAGSGSTGGAAAGGGANAGSGGGGGGAPSALSAEAQSAATGDIPDNQVFLTFHNGHSGYSIKYPEGWTIQGSGSDKLTISDKNNLVRVVIARGLAPSPRSVAAELTALKKSNPTLTFTAPRTFALPASSTAVKAVYTTQSAPDPVTGKRVKLIVDRYELTRGGHIATVDLGTPKGVDNVDAYRMMIESFRWL